MLKSEILNSFSETPNHCDFQPPIYSGGDDLLGLGQNEDDLSIQTDSKVSIPAPIPGHKVT